MSKLAVAFLPRAEEDLGKKFLYTVPVGIGRTNIEGNVYWTNFFEWLGEAREKFLFTIFPLEKFMGFFMQGGRIITHETSIKHVANAYLGDDITLELSFCELRHTSVKLLANFKNQKGEQIATGWQILVYADSAGVAKIPPDLKEAVLQYVAVPFKMG